ncbi:Uncharacterised protein [Mycobacteroides abscessus subsp. abscessus]|nr:Uncharacterised protein [Mycobacteroides abscessus subsp. abscessus]
MRSLSWSTRVSNWPAAGVAALSAARAVRSRSFWIALARLGYCSGPSSRVSAFSTWCAARNTAISAVSAGLTATSALAQSGAVSGVQVQQVARIWSAISVTKSRRRCRNGPQMGSSRSWGVLSGSQRSGPTPVPWPPVGSMRQSRTAATSRASSSGRAARALERTWVGAFPARASNARCLRKTGQPAASVSPGRSCSAT